MRLNIKYVLLSEHEPDWYEIKSKNEYAFWFVQEGTLTIEYEKECYELCAGDVFFFYPGVLYHAYSSGACRFTFLHFDAVLGANYQALHFYPFDGKYDAAYTSAFFDRLLDAAKNVQKNEPFAALEMEGAVMLFLACLMRDRYTKSEESPSVGKKSALARLQPALIYISHHLSEPICIGELAATVHLSEKYFITFFKNTMGITPRNYMIELKMKRALQYLYEQRYSVKEVAALTGYADIYTFSKAFKKMYGTAPSNI